MINKTYVYKHPCGAYRIGATKVSLDSIVYRYLEGESAESIAADFPAVTLEEVFGAIAFYLGNREEVHEYLKEQDARWEKVEAEIDAKPNPAWKRMLKIKHERQELQNT